MKEIGSWKIFEGDISEALDEGFGIIAYFGEDPNGKNYTLVDIAGEKSPSEYANDFLEMQDYIKQLEEEKKQRSLFWGRGNMPSKKSVAKQITLELFIQALPRMMLVFIGIPAAIMFILWFILRWVNKKPVL